VPPPRIDQREIETARYKVGDEPAAGAQPGPANRSNPDDETDPSAARLDEAVLTGVSNWRLNALGAVLGTALICALLLSVGLWVKLQRTRAELSEAELAAEMAEAALARDPEPEAEARPKAAAKAAAPEPEPVDLTASRAPPAPAEAAAATAAAPGDQLVLLLTVGTQHYAEKQLRSLRKRCRAPLAVYQQRRGRCGWSQCWAVAVPAEGRELARGCGAVKGQALRDRKDFLQLP
jgi:hypothetical protein